MSTNKKRLEEWADKHNYTIEYYYVYDAEKDTNKMKIFGMGLGFCPKSIDNLTIFFPFDYVFVRSKDHPAEELEREILNEWKHNCTIQNEYNTTADYFFDDSLDDTKSSFFADNTFEEIKEEWKRVADFRKSMNDFKQTFSTITFENIIGMYF